MASDCSLYSPLCSYGRPHSLLTYITEVCQTVQAYSLSLAEPTPSACRLSKATNVVHIDHTKNHVQLPASDLHSSHLLTAIKCSSDSSSPASTPRPR